MPTPAPKNAAKEAPREPLFEKFLKGFYGTLDVSFDDTTQGYQRSECVFVQLADPNNPNSGYVQGGAKSGPVGRLGYLPSFSTNKSQLGYRNTHQIGSSSTDFIIQVETSLALTSSPGLRTYLHPTVQCRHGRNRLGRHVHRPAEQQLGQVQDRHDVYTLQKIHRRAEPVLRHARRLQPSSWATRAATTASNS